MKWEAFRTATQNLDLIDATTLAQFAREDRGLYNQVSLWTRQGKIRRLTNGRYILNPVDYGKTISNEALSSRLVLDSYVSLQTALAHYRLIPDISHGLVVTAVTRRKTRIFTSPVGKFIYHHIRTTAFCGFTTVTDPHAKPYRLATREKSLLDALYFWPEKLRPSLDFLEEGLRLQQVETLSMRELRAWKGKFTPTMDQWIETIIEFKKENTR